MIKRLLLLIALPLAVIAASAQEVAERVEPLLNTVWGQDIPFNLHCPEKTNEQGVLQHCRVGCVACAMAQVMRYHEYPAVGIGKGQNIFNTALTANFGETWYDWDNMLESYADSYTREEAEAVATLMFHCGVAVNMIYGLKSSSTFTGFANNMTTALSRYFGYDETTLRNLNRSKYSKEEWLQIIYEELSAGRPIIYSGNSESMGGHTWVVDGYDVRGRVHMNWGWLGAANDYYDIDLNIPGLDFNQKQSMVIGIQKPQSTSVRIPEAAVRRTDSSDTVFDLQGRPVRRSSMRPGIYLHNGRKIIKTK